MEFPYCFYLLFYFRQLLYPGWSTVRHDIIKLSICCVPFYLVITRLTVVYLWYLQCCIRLPPVFIPPSSFSPLPFSRHPSFPSLPSLSSLSPSLTLFLIGQLFISSTAAVSWIWHACGGRLKSRYLRSRGTGSRSAAPPLPVTPISVIRRLFHQSPQMVSTLILIQST